MVETTGNGVRVQTVLDILPEKFLFGAYLIASIFLFVVLIVGAAGPDSYDRFSQLSFTCDGAFYYEFREGCNGTDLSNTSAPAQKIDIPFLFKPNNFEFSLIMWPYNAKYKEMDYALRSTLTVEISLYGGDYDRPGTLVFTETVTNELYCPRHRASCYGFLLFVERAIEYEHYVVKAKVKDSRGQEFVQNALWEISTLSADFNHLQLIFRYIYLSVAIILLVVWVVMMRRLQISEWPFQQKAVASLLIGLIFFNNPFYALLYNDTWLWAFLDEFFQILFTCLLFSYWFGLIEQVRFRYFQTPQLGWVWYTKAGIVIVYGVTSSLVVFWLDSKLESSAELAGMSGVIFFFYISSICCGASLVWVILDGGLYVPSGMRKQPHLRTRYLYLTLPTALVVVSMLTGLFSGAFGPYTHSSVTFMYFFGLFNFYVYLLVFGFFPTVSDMGREFEIQREEEGRLMCSGELSSENAARVLAPGNVDQTENVSS